MIELLIFYCTIQILNSCLLQKLTERTAALQKMKFKKTSDAEKWGKALTLDMMSSEESDEEVLKVHSLPWRAVTVGRMFHALDREAAKQRTPQSRRQMKERVVGVESSRPASDTACTWAVIK